LAVALGWLYPRGRWLFAAFAVMVACQRMEGGAHYLSDTLVGAAIGCLVATACVKRGWLAAQFERLERRHRERFPWTEEPTEAVEDHQSTQEAADETSRPRAA
jgi:membrane-associated phospholipid phosphatase